MVNATQRIITFKTLLSGRIIYTSQDGSREFISLLAYISTTGVALPPALIYKEDSGTLQDTWLEDWVSKDEAFFAVLLTGWSYNLLSLKWFKRVFNRCTAPIVKGRRRSLIVDGHSSYVNMKFIDLYDRLRILLLDLPSYSINRL